MTNATVLLSKESSEYKELEKRASSKYGETVNATGSKTIERYFSILALGRRELVKSFEEKELNFILDLFNGTAFVNTEIDLQGLAFSISDAADDYEGYKAKWEIDYRTVLEKLDSVSNFARLALIDFIEYFWHTQEDFGRLEPHKILRQM